MERYVFPPDVRAMLEAQQQPFAIYQAIDGKVHTLLVSEGFCRMLGYADHADGIRKMGRDIMQDIHPDDRERITEAGKRFSETDEYNVVYRTRSGVNAGWHVIHANGKHFYTDTGVRLSQVWYMDEGAYIEGDEASVTGINQTLNSALHEESIIRDSRYDDLTGLPNLAYFFKLCELGKARVISEGKQGSLLYVDLVGMKYYNHRCGFTAGDKLLKDYAALLSDTFGHENCCHIGADRFAVSTTDENLDNRLIKLLSDADLLENHLPMRVGVYSTALENVPVSTAYDRAKIACDSIRKSEFSSFRWYNREMGEADKRRRYIESTIDKAIAEKRIRLYCQAIVRAVNEKVCDEEALARWVDPELGFLSPAEFIPGLEESGQIYKLDLYMVEQVLQKINLQKQNGMTIVPHSINLSRSDFEACDIVEEIRKRVDEAGVGRAFITIEVTESVIAKNFDFMKKQIERFRALGFPVWLDDFGTGFTSFDVLQSIRFDLIKFDMSFMQKLNEGENGRIILTELVRLANSLGLDTVCEGVETKEQVRFLQEIGCSKLQGFYYNKPMPYEAILDRYEKGLDVGFEDTRASLYFETIGRINLYDLDVIASREEDVFRNTFNSMPMGIIEIQGDAARFIRCNPSYRDFLRRTFNMDLTDMVETYNEIKAPFTISIAQKCSTPGSRTFYDEKMPDGSVVHSFARRIGKNPVTGAIAVAVAVLSVTEPDQAEKIENLQKEMDALAQVMAMSEDYLSLYSVDPETGRYIEYTSTADYQTLGFEKEGADFFLQGVIDGRKTVHPADLTGYLRDFTKENVLRCIREEGRFLINYRLIIMGTPMPVALKIVPYHVGSTNRLLAGVRKWYDRE